MQLQLWIAEHVLFAILPYFVQVLNLNQLACHFSSKPANEYSHNCCAPIYFTLDISENERDFDIVADPQH